MARHYVPTIWLLQLIPYVNCISRCIVCYFCFSKWIDVNPWSQDTAVYWAHSNYCHNKLTSNQLKVLWSTVVERFHAKYLSKWFIFYDILSFFPSLFFFSPRGTALFKLAYFGLHIKINNTIWKKYRPNKYMYLKLIVQGTQNWH